MKSLSKLLVLAEDHLIELWNQAPSARQLEHRIELDARESVLAEVKHFVLFRTEDTTEWIVFTTIAAGLLIFDNAILHRKHEALSFKRACLYTLFYIVCAMLFMLYVLVSKGQVAAVTWSTGYILEWMLSVDNLFVFHMIFETYGTPDHLKHKPLFYGVVGALLFRMLFFILEETLFHAFWWAHLVFGAFLIYTGIKTAGSDDDEDPTENPIVIWIAERLPLIPGYDRDGYFFVRVPTYDSFETYRGEVQTADALTPPRGKKRLDSEDLSPTSKRNRSSCGYKATMLLVVVVCLEITDVIFAIDSVSAIVAEVPDLFLAYTACVFAMLGLRALFFVIDELIHMFSLLKYGVAFILVLIGCKLVVSKMVHIHPTVVFGILVGTLSVCMLASLWIEKRRQEDEESEFGGRISSRTWRRQHLRRDDGPNRRHSWHHERQATHVQQLYGTPVWAAIAPAEGASMLHLHGRGPYTRFGRLARQSARSAPPSMAPTPRGSWTGRQVSFASSTSATPQPLMIKGAQEVSPPGDVEQQTGRSSASASPSRRPANVPPLKLPIRKKEQPAQSVDSMLAEQKEP